MEDIITFDSPYHNNPKARKAIDAALERAAILMTKRGTNQLKTADGKLVDKLPAEEAKRWYQQREVEILLSVSDHDEDFIDGLITNIDKL
jgi:hypothetical protein